MNNHICNFTVPGTVQDSAPDTQAAIDFLKDWAAGGLIVLTAITPDTTDGAPTKTFRPDQEAEMRRWIDQRQGVANLYFLVNEPTRPLGKKASKRDIANALALHVDIDPPKDASIDLEAFRAEATEKLRNFEHPPTVIIDSGGGIHGFFCFESPVPIDEDLQKAEDFERYNRALIAVLGADAACFNVDRIMRLPGTVNVPDAKKRKAGRVARTARIIEWHSDRLYRLDQFRQAPAQKGSGNARKGNRTGVPKQNIPSLTDVPAIARYLERIGARVRSFSEAVIEEAGGSYKRIAGTVKFSPEGSITADNEAYAPTDAEKAEIADALKAISFPEHVTLDAIDPTGLPEELRRDMERNPERIFEFRDRKGRISMLQQRIEKKDGTKAYHPWTYWSDGQWRRKEPEGELPLWGAQQLKPKGIVFLHEGAKAARHAYDLNHGNKPVQPRSCPWIEDMREAAREAGHDAAHVGWIGGARNADRTDWKMLKDASRVYIICDNDQPGMKAASRISELLSSYDCAVTVVKFDDRFPESFDLADDFPKELFGPRKADDPEKKELAYIEPSLADCSEPGTWATTEIPPQGRGRPAHKIRDIFASEWKIITELQLYVNILSPGKLLNEVQFNTKVRPYSHVKNTADLIKNFGPAHVENVAYEPGLQPGVINTDKEKTFNVYVRPSVKAVKGDPKPFLDFMEHLFPNERDRLLVLLWIATLIARPDIRMKYSLLLISEQQGVGKTTLAEAILRPLVGKENTGVVSEGQLVDSAFNSYAARKRLLIIPEIYSGHSKKAYQVLKSILTDDTVRINEKHKSEYEIRNFIHMVASSNSMRAIQLDGEDRRWLIPEVTEKKKPAEFWEGFRDWLRTGGLGIILQWAIDYVKEHGPVGPGATAPETDRKRAVVEANLSEGQKLVRDLGEAAMDAAKPQKDATTGKETPGRKIIFIIGEVRQWLADYLGVPNSHPTLEKPETIGRQLRIAGMKNRKTPFKRKGVAFRVVANFHLEEGVAWSELVEYRTDPDDLIDKPF